MRAGMPGSVRRLMGTVAVSSVLLLCVPRLMGIDLILLSFIGRLVVIVTLMILILEVPLKGLVVSVLVIHLLGTVPTSVPML